MLKKKLRARHGETLVEVLASILVCGLAILLLTSMIMASMNINRRAREMDRGADGSGGFFGALSSVETHVFTAADPACPVTFTGDGRGDIEVDGVRSYTEGEGFSLTAYGKEAGA